MHTCTWASCTCVSQLDACICVCLLCRFWQLRCQFSHGVDSLSLQLGYCSWTFACIPNRCVWTISYLHIIKPLAFPDGTYSHCWVSVAQFADGDNFLTDSCFVAPVSSQSLVKCITYSWLTLCGWPWLYGPNTLPCQLCQKQLIQLFNSMYVCLPLCLYRALFWSLSLNRLTSVCLKFLPACCCV